MARIVHPRVLTGPPRSVISSAMIAVADAYVSMTSDPAGPDQKPEIREVAEVDTGASHYWVYGAALTNAAVAILSASVSAASGFAENVTTPASASQAVSTNWSRTKFAADCTIRR